MIMKHTVSTCPMSRCPEGPEAMQIRGAKRLDRTNQDDLMICQLRLKKVDLNVKLCSLERDRQVLGPHPGRDFHTLSLSR